MKPNQLFTSMLAVTALLVASCSAPRVAQNNAMADDVYNTTAQAKVYTPAPAVAIQNTQVENTDTEATDDYYGKSDPYYDMDYSSRIDRFYYGNMNRGYFDPFYNYYGYNSFYDPFWGGGFGGGFGLGFNNWGFNNWGFNNWGFYGGMGFDPFWGYYSNFNRFGTGYWGGIGWGGGWGGGFGGGFYAGRGNANYGPRPDRGGENGFNRPGRPGSVNGVPSRSNTFGNSNNGSVTRSRAGSYNPAANGSSARPNTSGSRPTRGEATARPTRSQAPPRQAPSYTPQRQSSPPPASSGGGSSRGGGGSSGGGGGGRPGRG